MVHKYLFFGTLGLNVIAIREEGSNRKTGQMCMGVQVTYKQNSTDGRQEGTEVRRGHMVLANSGVVVHNILGERAGVAMHPQVHE